MVVGPAVRIADRPAPCCARVRSARNPRPPRAPRTRPAWRELQEYVPCPRSLSPPRPVAPPAPARRAPPARRGPHPRSRLTAGQVADSISVSRVDLRHAVNSEAGRNTLIRIEYDGKSALTLIREMQRHPVRRDVTHSTSSRSTPPGRSSCTCRSCSWASPAGHRHGRYDRAAAEPAQGPCAPGPDPGVDRGRHLRHETGSPSWSRT